LGWALGDPANEDLLDALALDAADSFTQDEIDAAGIRLTPAQQAEFDALGRLPQTLWPSPEQRASLALSALSRPFTAEPTTTAPGAGTEQPARRAGDHGGADLLPALAARVLGMPLTVVTGEGRDQVFLPRGGDPASLRPATDPVLFLADGYFLAALPPGSPAPRTAALPGPASASDAETDGGTRTDPSAHRTHSALPWAPPADAAGPRYRLDRQGILTAPDGATYRQGTPTGRGNGFFGLLSAALEQAASRPGLDQREARRLTRRAEEPPAALMRMNGLPGTPEERGKLFDPPPMVVRPGAPAPGPQAVDSHLRRYLATAPWGPDADRLFAEWAASATGTVVTLIEENGTAHTYPGPAAAGEPHIRLRRRGGDFVPLTELTPATAPALSGGTPLPPPPGQDTVVPTSGQPSTVPAPARAAVPPPTGALADLAALLPGMTAGDRARELALLSSADRERLAADPALVAELRSTLSDDELAATAAQLLVHVASGVDQPVSAGHTARERIAAMLRDPAVAIRLLERGARVLVVPKNEALTTLGPFRELAGRRLSPTEPRTWDTVRGVGQLSTGVTEENLLGETTGVPGASSYVDGYSTTTHEFAHTIHLYGLSESDRRTITAAYHAKLNPTDGQDPAHVEWPDGPRRSAVDGRPTDNYASTNEFEYFAQAVNAYLSTNTGHDPYTRQPRNNGPDWVRANEPGLLPLLERLFGATPGQDGPGPANPVEATRAENEMYEGFRALWDQTEGLHLAQPHPAAPMLPATPTTADAGTTDDGPTALPPPPDRRSGWAEPPEGLIESLDRLRAGDPDAEALSRFRFTETGDSDDSASVESDAGTVPHGWGDLLFGPAARYDYSPEALAEAVRSLEELSRRDGAHASGATGVLDSLHDLARRVLNLDPGTPVGPRDLLLLGSLALSASPDELADEDLLAAYLTRLDIALSEGTLVASGRSTGRNWAGVGGRTPPLDSYAAQDENGLQTIWPAPWPAAYVVLAQPSGGTLPLHTPDGTLRLEEPEQLAGLVARDPRRDEGTDVVLAFSHEEIESVARFVADLTGSRVWFPNLTGSALGGSPPTVRLATDWRGGPDRLSIGPIQGGSTHAWMSLRPGQEPVAGERAPDGLETAEEAPDRTGSTTAREARRARPLLTRNYGIIDRRGDGVLFRTIGNGDLRWNAPRALEGTEYAPELALPVQLWDVATTDDRPVVRISADRTLAVLNDAYGQQVYATPRAVEEATAKLKRAGLIVRLSTDDELGIVLPLPGGGSRQLFRVTPFFVNREGDSTEEVCRDFADMLADEGRTSHLIFRTPHGGPVVTAPVNATSGTEVTGTHHLAEGLAEAADGDVSLDRVDSHWAASLVRQDDRPAGGDDTGPTPAEAYGSALSLEAADDPRRERLTAAALRIGVNEHAWADVGEGYLVQSIAAPGENGPSLATNYAVPSSPPDASHFGYHFITVVLASEDGTHQVSLENHARQYQHEERYRRTVTANYEARTMAELQELKEDLGREIARQEADGVDENLREVQRFRDLTILLISAKNAEETRNTFAVGTPEHTQAHARFTGLLRSAAQRVRGIERVVPGNRRWYMRMYTQRPGESAHDVNAHLVGDEPSAEANPLTASVVRGQQLLPVQVLFEPGTERMPEGSTQAVRYLSRGVARTGLWNHANGLPLPEITLTGHRPGRLGRDLGKIRAQAAAETVRRELETALAQLQDGLPGPHLSADLFTVRPVSTRDRGSSAADAVHITVDDRRGGPRRVAVRGLRGGSPDDGLDPMAEQWPIGRPVTVMRPRFGERTPPAALSVSEAPEPDRSSTSGKGKSPEPGPRRWFPYIRTADSRPEPFRYEVADTGHLRLPTGRQIPPTGWTRFGDDFVHTETGALLRGDSGWLGRVANIDTLAAALSDLDPDAAPYRVTTDGSSLHLVPEDSGGTAFRIPLREGPAPRARIDDRPRVVVRSSFDVRRIALGGETVTDLEIRLALRPGDGEEATDTVLAGVREGVEEFYNRPEHRLPNGDRVHITITPVAPEASPHLTVDLVGRDRPMNQRAWWADAEPVEFAHELAHQLFLRDETRGADNPARLHAPGSLLGPFREQAPAGLAQGGLRDRHLQVWAAVVGDLPAHVVADGTSWDQAWADTREERRERVWADPVSLPAPSPQTEPDGSVPPPLPPGTLPADSDESADPPVWTWPDWLAPVFGPQWRQAPEARLQETSQALYARAEETAAGRSLRDGLADLTRQVLHLPDNAPVTAQDVLALGSLALEASSDDLASAEDLALYFVDRQIEFHSDALAEDTLVRTADGQPVGRDFTDADEPAPALDVTFTERFGRLTRLRAPWRNPYLFVAEEAEGGGIEIVTPTRTFVVRDEAEMARIVSYDSRRPPGADIVLALPAAYAPAVADLVAGTTARPVWYPQGPVEIATHPRTQVRHLVLHQPDGDPEAGWATPPPPREPGLAGARDLSSDSESDADSETDSDGDAEFDRMVEELERERRIDALRPRPLITRDYQVVDESGTGVLFTGPGTRTVGEVSATADPDAPTLVLPRQTGGEVRATERPPLHISADRTLALLSAGDDTTGRSRQVYATRVAIERASARLTAAGAGVRLVADPSVSLLLNHEDGSTGEPLLRVEPRFLTPSGVSEHAFTRDFARMVAGTGAPPLSHLAFRSPSGALATAPANAQHSREVTGTHHLAQALAGIADGTRPATDATPRWAAHQVAADPRFGGGVVGAPMPGAAYGSALSQTPDNTRRGPLTAAAARAGINEFAWAEVGEGYLIQSVSTTNDGVAQLFTHNHAKPGDPAGPHAPYHFAQVVLASEDGTHQITLENETHTRAETVADQLDTVVDENLERYDEDQLERLADDAGRLLETVRRDGAGTTPLESFIRAARALAEVHRAEQVQSYFTEDRPEHALAQREIDVARGRARDAVRAAAPVTDSTDLWFFRAYSKRPGESAHAVNAALLADHAPSVANPLTTVALHGHAPLWHHRTIPFARERHTPSAEADATLDGVALSLVRTGLWNRAHGLPLPMTTLTGHGNRSQASGRKRAEAVRSALLARLERLLKEHQAGASGPLVTPSDFPVALEAKRVRRAADPDLGRLVTVGIDDRRGTPAMSPSPATSALPSRTGTPDPSRSTSPAPAAGERSRSPRRSTPPGPDRGTPVPAWVQARIRYAQESAVFERRLADHLADNQAVVEEFRKMARAAWEQARMRYPNALGAFGSAAAVHDGAVGTGRPALQRVVRDGNLRELVRLMFQGISTDLVPEMLGGVEEQHPEIAAERPSRRTAEVRSELERLAQRLQNDPTLSPQERQDRLREATRPLLVQTDPGAVRPPLSDAERGLGPADGRLAWYPASSQHDIAMSAVFQSLSEDTGGLVMTGTSGSTYRFLVHAARMRDQWGVDLDLGLIRAGMIATSLPAGHHSFHEVMRGAQLALDDMPGHDPALDYQDNWGRYWNVYPLTEQELRDHVARDGRFPDEHAGEALAEPAPVARRSLPLRSIPTRPVAARPNRPAPQLPNHPSATAPPPAASPAVRPVTAAEAEQHREALLDALYGLGSLDGIPREAAAEGLERLDRLRQADPGLSGGFLDLDAVARRVLLMAPADPLNAAARTALLRLATDPSTTGAVGLDGLSAHHLVRRGAFHPDFRLTDAQGRARGWNWLGRPLPADFDPDHTGRVTRTPDGTTGHSDPWDAPWRPAPGHPAAYTLLLTAGSASAVVRGLGGFSRSVSPEVLRELLALDPELTGQAADVPLLLHVERAAATDLELPRRIADRLGRQVWATAGRAGIGRLPGTPGGSMLLLLDEVDRAPRAQWLLSSPATSPASPPTPSDDGIAAVSIGHGGPGATGYISMDLASDSDGGWSRTLAHSGLGSVTVYTHQRNGYGFGRPAPAPVPWVELNLAQPYFANNHGLPGAVMWHTSLGERRDDGPRFARTLARRRSLASLDPEHPVVLLICYAATAPGIGEMHGRHIDGPLPFVPDPLASVAVAQHAADETGRTVFASVLMNAVEHRPTGSPEPRINLQTDARGRAHDWVMFRPEPTGDAVDARARDAGLHQGPGPVPPETAERTLRLVRALRRIFGPTVDDTPEYPRLLRGMGALDLMRGADPRLDRDGARRFTMDLYEQILRRHSGADLSGPVPAFTPDAHRALLTEAADRLDAGRRGPLTDWIGLPHLTHMLDGLAAAPHRATLAREVLGLEATDPVGEAELSRLLWASYRVATFANGQDHGLFAAVVLHLPAPDATRYDEALQVARRAAAAGRDLWQVHELTAFHLEQQGVLDEDRLLTRDDGTSWGRALDGVDRPEGAFDPSVITLLGRAADGSLVPVGAEPAPWAADPHRPAPFVYVADGDADALRMPGPVPPREFGELVFRDPELIAEDGYAEVVAVIPHGSPAAGGPAGGTVPGEGARNSARNWWTTSGATTLHHDPATGTYTVALLPGPDGQPGTAASWSRTEPSDGDLSGTAPDPGHAPVPTAANSASSADDRLTSVWQAHTRALAAFGEATAEAAGLQRSGQEASATESAWSRADAARRPLEDAEARLREGGVAAEALGAARTTAPVEDSTPTDAAPVVPRDAELVRWLTRRVTEADLPYEAPTPGADETVGIPELMEAGGTPSPGQRTEAMLRADGRLPASTLTPLDLTRVRLSRAEPWTRTLDKVAADVARRLWAQTRSDLTAAAPQGTDDEQLDRAWSAALALVLPPEPHPVLADFRYAADGYRDAVRRVAAHLLAEDSTPFGTGDAQDSAAELADTLRAGLGLPPRWTASTSSAAAEESAPEPPPAGRSQSGADLDSLDFGALGDLDGFGFSLPGTDLPDADLGRFRTPAGLHDAPWASDDRGRKLPVPILVQATPDADDPDLVEVTREGRTHRMPLGEFAELLAHEPASTRPGPIVPVVLAFPDPVADAGPTADRVARRLGRGVWWTGFPADLSGTDDSGTPVLTLRASADGSLPGAWSWQQAQPAHPDRTQEASRPRPEPLPRSGGRVGRGEEPGPDWAFAPAHESGPAPLSPVSAASSAETSTGTDVDPETSGAALALLSDATLLTDVSGAARGRDWTGAAAGVVDPSRIRLRGLGDGADDVTEQPAPWGRDAYVIAAEGGYEELFAAGRELGPEEIAELLAADPVLALLPPGVPVVLASPYAGAQDGRIAHAVARRLGRRVWAPSGDGRLESMTEAPPAPGSSRSGAGPLTPTLVDADPNAAYGDWVPFDPPADGASALPVDREWVTVDGIRFRDSDVDTRPLVGSDHRFEGRESMPDDGRGRLRERRLRRWREMRERTHVVRVGDAYHTVASEEVTPDPEASVYTFHAHGVPGGLKLVHQDGRVLLLGAEEGGRYVGGLPEVVARAAGDELHLASCYGGVPGDPRRDQPQTRPAPPVEDPWEEVATAQHVANHSGRTTTAATGRTGYNDTGRLLAATPDGTFARMETFRPEPVDDTARFAAVAGLRPLTHPSGLDAWDGTGPRVLRLVRALRQVFGNDVEADLGVPGGRYERLLRGIGALETLRANDPSLAALTPLRRELWDLLAAPPGGARPTAADHEAVLDRALAASSDASLTDVWTAPALRTALSRLDTHGDAEVRAVLRRPAGPVGPRDRARALWAMTGAARLLDARSPAEREEGGRTALHVPADAPWDATAEVRLRELAEQALAAGRAVGDLGDLAVFHLESLGAFAEGTLVRRPGGTLQGRNWGPVPTPGGIDPLRLSETGPDGTATLRFAPWAQEGAPAPWFVYAETDDSGAVVLRLPGGTVHVPPDQVYALLVSDPEPALVSSRRPLVLLVSGLDAGPDTALGEFALRNDRTVWSYGGPLLLPEGDGPSHSAVPTTRPNPRVEPAEANPEPAAWVSTRPRLPVAPVRPSPADSARWNAQPEADASAVPATPLPYSADGTFDRTFAETVAEFPVADSTERHTVWGFGEDDPDYYAFVAEIPSLGLRGEYTSDGPSAGGVTDMSGRIHRDGPAWNWYLPGRGLVASSRLETRKGVAEPVPVGWPATGPVSPTPPVDPAVVAAVPVTLEGATLPDALWRDHDGPLYRFSPDGPERIFSEGLKPYGPEMVHLIDHVYGGSALVPNTVFASSTANPHYVRDSALSNPLGADALHRRYRWRYDIQAPGGIDVNATLGLASPFPDQEEVLFPGGIARRYIRGAQPMMSGMAVGPYVPNPHFEPHARVQAEDADFSGPAAPGAGPVLESFPALSLDTDGESDSDDDPRPLLSRDDSTPPPSRGREPSTDRETTPAPVAPRPAVEPHDSSDSDEDADELPAPAWVLARVRYAQEALYFERRLAAHLGENRQINEEYGKVVRAFWHIALSNRLDYRLFGSDRGEDGGAVGTAYESLARVVESGNLRERVTFLFNGVASNLVPYLMGGVEPQHPVIGVERRDRHRSEQLRRFEREVAELRDAELDPEDEAQEMAELEAMLRTPLRPHEVGPALSPAERRLAVRDGILLWSPAGQLHTLPMAADFQARSEDSGGLVLTGTSGSAYRIITHVARLNRLAGVSVDLGLIRSGLASILVGVGHHSFHEVMTGAQHALDEIDPGAASVYADNWGRYWDVHPLTEEELRTFVAREGRFPDEHARALSTVLEEQERRRAEGRRDGGEP
ncbi:lonely Cys domain-containing protein, partial [Streptomyces griseus]|uniref:lonely Cys domain-containing protein n=2 Tax=Streptomyces TaxID=1883 RepID=UPI001E3D8B8F